MARQTEPPLGPHPAPSPFRSVLRTGEEGLHKTQPRCPSMPQTISKLHRVADPASTMLMPRILTTPISNRTDARECRLRNAMEMTSTLLVRNFINLRPRAWLCASSSKHWRRRLGNTSVHHDFGPFVIDPFVLLISLAEAFPSGVSIFIAMRKACVKRRCSSRLGCRA